MSLMQCMTDRNGIIEIAKRSARGTLKEHELVASEKYFS
jgi:hypothetical protein